MKTAYTSKVFCDSHQSFKCYILTLPYFIFWQQFLAFNKNLIKNKKEGKGIFGREEVKYIFYKTDLFKHFQKHFELNIKLTISETKPVSISNPVLF